MFQGRGKSAVAKWRELIEVSVFTGAESVSWHRCAAFINDCQALFSVFIIVGRQRFFCWAQIVE
jgi:hypothetical protein